VCRPFRKGPNSECSDDDYDSGKEDFFLKEFEKAKKQKTKKTSNQSDYIDCNFITGSAAVLQSLRSTFNAFNTKRCHGMSPITIRMTIVLKKNRYLWSIKDINRANQSWIRAGRSERLEREMVEHEEFMKDLEHFFDWKLFCLVFGVLLGLGLLVSLVL
jgi:hypothetical protein